MPDPYRIHTDLDALSPDLPADSILSRTLYENDRMKVVLFEFAEGRFEFVDCEGQMRIGSQRLLPRGVIRSGRLVRSEKDRLIQAC